MYRTYTLKVTVSSNLAIMEVLTLDAMAKHVQKVLSSTQDDPNIAIIVEPVDLEDHGALPRHNPVEKETLKADPDLHL